jgi:hypothetical protein
MMLADKEQQVDIPRQTQAENCTGNAENEYEP